MRIKVLSKMSPKPYMDPLVEVIDFHSELNGSAYEVRIGLPPSYRMGEEKYPVLVVLDADISFGTTYETTLLEAMWSKAPLGNVKPIPEFIVVGIALPDRATNPFRRNFEYMPAGDPSEYSHETKAYMDRVSEMTGGAFRPGGASVFLNVLKKEILSLVEAHYRVDDSRKILFGQSAGGTFCCYTLFTKPQTFTDYVIVSPGLPDREIFRLEAAWAEKHDDLRVGVFLSAGQKEMHDPLHIVSNTAQLAEQMNARRYPSLRLNTWLIPDASHVQTAAPSLARALGVLTD